MYAHISLPCRGHKRQKTASHQFPADWSLTTCHDMLSRLELLSNHMRAIGLADKDCLTGALPLQAPIKVWSYCTWLKKVHLHLHNHDVNVHAFRTSACVAGSWRWCRPSESWTDASFSRSEALTTPVGRRVWPSECWALCQVSSQSSWIHGRSFWPCFLAALPINEETAQTCHIILMCSHLLYSIPLHILVETGTLRTSALLK